MCTTRFKYFRHGRLFEFEAGVPGGRSRSHPPIKGTSRELFWLCHDCNQKFTLHYKGNGQVVPVPRPHRSQAA